MFDAGRLLLGDPFFMSDQRDNDPLHGKTLKAILTELVEKLGWEEMSSRISINCFASDPSINSSLTFLRKTSWARTKLENLYLEVNGHPIPLRRKKFEPEKTTPSAPQKPSTGPRARLAAQSSETAWNASKPDARGKSSERDRVAPRRPAKKPDGINVWTGKPFGEEE